MGTFQPILLIRADANAAIGSGHVMRCLAIAQAWKRTGGKVHFACRELPESLHDRLVDSGCCVHRATAEPGSRGDCDDLESLARDVAADWVIADGYSFREDFQRQLLGASKRLLLIRDDDRTASVSATTVLNPNVFARREHYPTISEAKLLLGPRYALLRDEFREDAHRALKFPQKKARRILVTFGGADPKNMTARTLAALSRLGDGELTVDVVLGSGPKQCDPAGIDSYPMRVRWHQHVSNMAALMGQADVAITAGGSTCFELAAVGVPMFIVSIADNQLPVAKSLAEMGAAIFFGQQHELSDETFKEMLHAALGDAVRRHEIAATAKLLVDGRGAGRIVARMLRPMVRLRPAQTTDAQRLYDWQQDPNVRRWSFSQGPANYAEHCQWLSGKLADGNAELLICQIEDGSPVGFVRLDRMRDRGSVGLLLDRGLRGRGLAEVVLGVALDRFAKRHPGLAIDAWIKPGNEASRRTFAAVGFVQCSSEKIQGESAERWNWQPSDTRVSTAALDASSGKVWATVPIAP